MDLRSPALICGSIFLHAVRPLMKQVGVSWNRRTFYWLFSMEVKT